MSRSSSVSSAGTLPASIYFEYPDRLLRIPRQLAIEHAHHRFEVHAFAVSMSMLVVPHRPLNLGDDIVGNDFEFAAGAHREHLRPAHAFEHVKPPVRLRHRFADDEHPMVFHE